MARQSSLEDIYGVKSAKANPFASNSDAAETGVRHSDAYHRYFRGYTEVRCEMPNGRCRIKRIYTRDWIVPGGTAAQDILYRIGIAVLTFLTWSGILHGLGADVPSNAASLPSALAGISVLFMAVFSAVVLLMISAPRKRTQGSHSLCRNGLQRLALFQSITTLLTIPAKLLSAPITHAEIVSCIHLLGACCASAAILILEHRRKYEYAHNGSKLPEGESHEIW
jgi:hypothetical protein